MFSKRKVHDDDKNSKKLKKKSQNNISSYIEHERKKYLEDIDPLEALRDILEKSKRFFTMVPSYPAFRDCHFLNTNVSLERNIIPYNLLQHLSSNSYIYSDARHEVLHEINILRVNPDLNPIDIAGSSRIQNFEESWETSDNNTQDNETENVQDSNLEFDPMWGPHFHNPSASSSEPIFLRHLEILIRNWDVTTYQKCMYFYSTLIGTDRWFVEKILIKILPPVMLKYCDDSKIIADFFQTMCKSYEMLSHLVHLKPCYLHFFLMNLAAVNQIEFSLSIEIGTWKSAKSRLIERAFVLGQTANLQLLLQYLTPCDFWPCCDLRFLEGPIPFQMGIAKRMSNYEKQNVLIIFQLANCVSKSNMPKSILADCIRLLWRTLEMPYISPRQIDEAFYTTLYQTTVHKFKISLLQAYPIDCFDGYQPRSLMHLSRCKVREYITSAAHVFYLPLPNKLKAYINLEW